MVLVGTNNEALRDPKQGGDRGVLMAFRESDGEFLWQRRTRSSLRPRQRLAIPGHCLVTARRATAWRIYVSNRGQVIAADLDGFHDGRTTA
jgi:outer membrane protein assembly factor BamB